MKLLVDIGNTRLKSALLHNGILIEPRALSWRVEDLSDGLARLWRDFEPDKIAVSSVAGGAVVDAVGKYAKDHWQIEPKVAEYRGELFGLSCGYLDPETLGIDRWLAMLGAYGRHPGAWVVADLGTAATLDVIDQSGQHLGGCIYAGIETQRQALSRQTANLPAVDKEPTSVLARETHGGIAIGTLLSVTGGVRELWREVQDRPDCEGIKLCLTGGAATIVAERLGGQQMIFPDLVLEGLAMNEFATKISAALPIANSL